MRAKTFRRLRVDKQGYTLSQTRNNPLDPTKRPSDLQVKPLIDAILRLHRKIRNNLNDNKTEIAQVRINKCAMLNARLNDILGMLKTEVQEVHTNPVSKRPRWYVQRKGQRYPRWSDN